MSTSSSGVREALSRRPALSTSMSFRAAAAIAFLVFAANAAVSPLYRIYQAEFGFSATTLTLLFAVYIAVLLLTLLFLGSVSDYAGRRPVMLAGLPLLVGTWALAGVYLSLGPSLAAQLLHSKNLVWGGILIFLLTGLGAAASAVLAKRDPSTVMLGGCLALIVGALVTLASIQPGTPVALFVGTMVAGPG